MELEIRNVSKTYSNGVQALKDVTLTIPVGMYGLLGPNGSGKSTLMRTIATLQEPDAGSIRLGDLDVLRQKDEVRKVLGYVGLDQKATALGRDLNAHDRRMVEIARAVAGTPKLVMMDEPGAGLSQDEAAHLRDVILGIPDFCGAQVLLVDHDVDLISATCQATLVLDFGSKLAYGPTAEVLKDPKVQAAYLGVFEEDAA